VAIGKELTKGESRVTGEGARGGEKTYKSETTGTRISLGEVVDVDEGTKEGEIGMITKG